MKNDLVDKPAPLSQTSVRYDSPDIAVVVRLSVYGRELSKQRLSVRIWMKGDPQPAPTIHRRLSQPPGSIQKAVERILCRHPETPLAQPLQAANWDRPESVLNWLIKRAEQLA